MSIGDITTTVIGNLTKDPELRVTPSGASVVAFTIASSSRVYDQQAGEWKDGATVFMRCSAWRHMADHIAETIEKGTRVIAHGRLKQRTWTDNNNVERIVIELEVDEIGPSLKYATATVKKTTRGAGGAEPPHPATTWGNGTGQPSGGWGNAPASAGGWDNAAAGTGGWSASDDEPPF